MLKAHNSKRDTYRSVHLYFSCNHVKNLKWEHSPKSRNLMNPVHTISQLWPIKHAWSCWRYHFKISLKIDSLWHRHILSGAFVLKQTLLIHTKFLHESMALNSWLIKSCPIVNYICRWSFYQLTNKKDINGRTLTATLTFSSDILGIESFNFKYPNLHLQKN